MPNECRMIALDCIWSPNGKWCGQHAIDDFFTLAQQEKRREDGPSRRSLTQGTINPAALGCPMETQESGWLTRTHNRAGGWLSNQTKSYPFSGLNDPLAHVQYRKTLCPSLWFRNLWGDVLALVVVGAVLAALMPRRTTAGSSPFQRRKGRQNRFWLPDDLRAARIPATIPASPLWTRRLPKFSPSPSSTARIHPTLIRSPNCYGLLSLTERSTSQISLEYISRLLWRQRASTPYVALFHLRLGRPTQYSAASRFGWTAGSCHLSHRPTYGLSLQHLYELRPPQRWARRRPWSPMCCHSVGCGMPGRTQSAMLSATPWLDWSEEDYGDTRRREGQGHRDLQRSSWLIRRHRELFLGAVRS